MIHVNFQEKWCHVRDVQYNSLQNFNKHRILVICWKVIFSLNLLYKTKQKLFELNVLNIINFSNIDYAFVLGEYEQNLCTKGDRTCAPCPERLPSCRGLPDGPQPDSTHLWVDQYVTCFANRTMAVKTCNHGYFHPRQHQCRSQVDPGRQEFC